MSTYRLLEKGKEHHEAANELTVLRFIDVSTGDGVNGMMTLTRPTLLFILWALIIAHQRRTVATLPHRLHLPLSSPYTIPFPLLCIQCSFLCILFCAGGRGVKPNVNGAFHNLK